MVGNHIDEERKMRFGPYLVLVVDLLGQGEDTEIARIAFKALQHSGGL